MSPGYLDFTPDPADEFLPWDTTMQEWDMEFSHLTGVSVPHALLAMMTRCG